MRCKHRLWANWASEGYRVGVASPEKADDLARRRNIDYTGRGLLNCRLTSL